MYGVEGRRNVLLLVAMDSKSRPTVLAKILGDIVRNSLGTDEDENLGVFLADLIQVLDELRSLLEIAANFYDLLNVVVGSKLSRTNVDLDEIFQEILRRLVSEQKECEQFCTYIRELLNILRPSGREHQRLTIRADLADDFTDLRLETHVKHAISFVHDEVCDTTQVSLAGFQHINETPRGRDDNLDTALEVTDLGTLGRTTVDGSVSDARVGAELCAFLLDLYGKFTSRGEDESDGTISRCEERLTTSG